jgi:hypothetical protein
MWGQVPRYKTDQPNGVWDTPARVAWRKVHGEIPKSHVVRVLDGNLFNNAIENLECLSMSENAIINGRRLFVEDGKLNRTACLVAKIYSAVNKKAGATI